MLNQLNLNVMHKSLTEKYVFKMTQVILAQNQMRYSAMFLN